MPAEAKEPREPRIPGWFDAGRGDAIEHDATLTEIELSGETLTRLDARGFTFQASRMVRCELAGARLDRVRIVDSEVVDCNLANLDLRGGSAERSAFSGNRLTGAVFTEVDIADVTFRGCRVDLAAFGFAALTRVSFEDCMLAGSSFIEAKLDDVRFHDCDLSRADFRGATLLRCELRRCDLTGLEGVASLRGAAMQWGDILAMAGVWAGALGIGVLDIDVDG